MSLRIWTGDKEFDTTHERRALARLVREMATRYRSCAEPYTLFVDFSAADARIDLLALTRRAVVVVELKEVGRPGAVVHGTQNGDWQAVWPDGSRQELNPGRRNPLQQADAYRWAMIDWLDRNGDQVFGPQRKAQLKLDPVDAWVVVSPAIDEKAMEAGLGFVTPKMQRWFRVLGLDGLCSALWAQATPGLELHEDEIERIAACLGLHEKKHFFDLLLADRLEIPKPRIFGSPRVIRYSVDREGELDRLSAAVGSADCSVLVIGGPGGVGKTHLASMVAELETQKRPVFWVDCADHPALSLETLLLAFANELPHSGQAQFVADPDEPEADRLRTVVDYLEQQRACLVLDDYHALSPGSGVDKLIRRMDQHCRQAKVVLTTRRRPAFQQDAIAPLSGCWELPLAGLPVGSVVQYLNDRGRGHCLGVTDRDAPLLWQKTGGGVPTVLDILARVSRGRSPVEVATGFGIYGRESASGWFQALLDAVSKEARRVAAVAAVTRGPLAMDLLAALCPAQDVARCVDELVDNFIVHWDEQTGHYALSTLLQEFLYNLLPARTQKRFHELAAEWLWASAEAERDGYGREVRQSEALYHAQAAGRSDLVLERAGAVVDALSGRGEWAIARATCEWALAAAHGEGREPTIAQWQLEMARQMRHAGQMSEAAAACREGLATAERLEARDLLARAYHEMGMLAYRQNRLDEAREWHWRALRLDQALDHPAHAAASLGKLGDIARQQDHPLDALGFYQESARLSESMCDAAALAIVYIQLGTLHKNLDEPLQARTYLVLALANAERTRRPASIAIAQRKLAQVMGRLGDYDQGLDLIERSLQVRRELLDFQNQRIGQGIRVELLLAAGRLDEAEASLRELEAAMPAGDLLGRTFNLKRRGLLAIRRGHVESGTSLARRAAAAFQVQGQAHHARDTERDVQAALSSAAAGK